MPFPNVASTLQGRASGVIVQNQGGEPGSEPKISIRGGGDPLYVIDGIITTDWEFKTLNSEDIESISILKDAASLAVYGSRAADGIVLVKTKEGRKGKRSIVYSFNAQYSQPTVCLLYTSLCFIEPNQPGYNRNRYTNIQQYHWPRKPERIHNYNFQQNFILRIIQIADNQIILTGAQGRISNRPVGSRYP